MRITLFFLVIGLFGCAKNKKTVTEPMANLYPQKEVNQLPVMTLVDANKDRIDANKLTGKNIFILFFPDCEHCQREATEIAERITSFENYTIYFVSINPFEEIIGFSKKYKLDKFVNVKFVQTTGDAVYTNFGSVPTPSMYIFNNGKLIKKFNGETKVDEILRYL
jgi:peroxiredoxin